MASPSVVGPFGATGPLTVWGLLAGVAGGLLGPGPAHWLQLPTYALLRWVETVATTAARHPIAADGRALLGLLALGCAAAATLAGRRKQPGRVTGDGAVPPR